MNTIPIPLLIIAGLSLCLLMVAVVLVLPYDIEDQLNIKHPNPKIGPSGRQRCWIVVFVWLVPSLLAVAGWFVWSLA